MCVCVGRGGACVRARARVRACAFVMGVAFVMSFALFRGRACVRVRTRVLTRVLAHAFVMHCFRDVLQSHALLPIYVHTRTHAHTHTRTHTMCVCVRVCMFVCVCVCVRACVGSLSLSLINLYTRMPRHCTLLLTGFCLDAAYFFWMLQTKILSSRCCSTRKLVWSSFTRILIRK